MKVSIIVPVYNSEKYIQNCIDNIKNQNYMDWDLILVNYGSLDNSLKICEDNSKNDKRIIVVSQKNMGSNFARKAGTDIARGSLITYIDADDYIECDYIEKLVTEMKNSDLVISGYVLNGKNISCGVEKGKYYINSDSPVINKMMGVVDNSLAGIITSMWGKIYKKEIAKKIFNDLDMSIYYGEDAEFIFNYIINCKCVTIIDYCGYHYRDNYNSITHSLHEDFLINVNRLYLSLKESFEKSEYKEALMPQLEKWISKHILLSYEIIGFKYARIEPITYIIPCKSLIANKSIAVYGAGRVGRDYVRQIVKEKLCKKVVWFDKDYEKKNDLLNIKVEPIKNIKYYEIDLILIAISNEKVIAQVKEMLESMKIEGNKILDYRPLYLENFYYGE